MISSDKTTPISAPTETPQPIDPDAPENFGVAKTSAWADKDDPAPEVDERVGQEPPDWERAFRRGTTLVVNGYECQVLQVGFAGGRWMVLMEPKRLADRASTKRAEKSEKKSRGRRVKGR